MLPGGVNLNVFLIYGELNMSCFGENWGLEFSREEIDQALADKKILSLELELTHACNLRCIYCYAESGKALENELSYSEIIDAVDQLKYSSLDEVHDDSMELILEDILDGIYDN